MRVICDNCGASYRIPDHKLVKEVNKATCRKCGEAIIIRKSAGMAVGNSQQEVDPEASTQVTELAAIKGASSGSDVAAIPSGPAMGHGFGQPANLPEDAGPPTVAQHMDFKDETIPRQDLPEPTAARPPAAKAKAPAPPVPVSTAPPPAPPMPMSPHSAAAPPPTPSPARAKKGAAPAPQHEFSGALTVVMMSNFACAAGALFIVVAQESWHRPMGLFVCLAGAILSLSVVISSDRGRRPASMLMSYLVSFLVAGAAAFGLHTQENLGDPAAVASNSEASGSGSVVQLTEENPLVDGSDEEPGDADGDENLDDPEAEPNTNQPAPSKVEIATVPRSGTGAFPAGESSKEEEPSRAAASQDWDDDWNDDFEEPAPARKDPPPPPPPPRRAEPEPEPEPAASEGVPLVVLDTMLRSNRKVKGCFVAYKRETGTMPSGRINVKFKVRASGRPQEVRIAGGPYVNTSLDVCLDSAVSAIQFPPFEGEAKTYTYPFVL